jgi:uncharacterized membrane protein YtjA (UPF0391 family)
MGEDFCAPGNIGSSFIEPEKMVPTWNEHPGFFVSTNVAAVPAARWRGRASRRNQKVAFALTTPGNDSSANKGPLMSLLKWALIFLLISIVAALFGFTGISAATADIARILFYIFVVIFLVLLILGLVVFRGA